MDDRDSSSVFNLASYHQFILGANWRSFENEYLNHRRPTNWAPFLEHFYPLIEGPYLCYALTFA